MSVVLVTGSSGLIGSETVEFYANLGYQVVGIDNNMREIFFGPQGSTIWNRNRLMEKFRNNYTHYNLDIRDANAINQLFQKYQSNISLIIHTAAQPSHDWAAKDPLMDFGVNANGTLHLLEAMRKYSPDAVFIFTSTNKVYGDNPNTLPLIEHKTRWEIDQNHRYQNGIPETMSVDQNMHSLFGSSKLAADILVQEYGRYFGFKTVTFRGGVLSGAKQSGVQLHGFINYLMKCIMTDTPYTIIGYKGKQVRDVIDSRDVVAAFHAVYENPKTGGAVYNLGGGRDSNISILEAITLAEQITSKKLNYTYQDIPRAGDHIWYISDLTKFKSDYPNWKLQKNIQLIMEEIYEQNKIRWQP